MQVAKWGVNTEKIGLKDNQTKAKRTDLNKFTIGPVRGGKF